MSKTKWSKTFWADLGERVGSTFIVALIPMWVAAGNVAHLDFLNAVEVAGSAAGLSLLKGLLANLADGESGPSLLPAPPAPPVPEAPADGKDDLGHWEIPHEADLD